ncbi:DNA repair protein RecN [Dehalogenimonas sp. THU2]|uniref:DNA repair protein RecN n=1 Tax=Dehalogenimonas sp. THU2 TaxID=3151121 RepID=UPI00321871A6
MLLRLRVRNFGIIEDFDWTPGAGLNVLTGETGAGKSLVVDAVSSLLSGRLEEPAVRHGAEESRLEGVFDVSLRPDLAVWLCDKGIVPDEEGQLIVSLSLKRGRRAAMRLNDDTVSRGLITELGRQLIDIHGQSQHLSLLDKASHLDFLDASAGTAELRQTFGQAAQALHRLEKQIDELAAGMVDRARQRDYLAFQVQEIERASLCDGEDIELENERRIQASAEKLKALAFEAVRSLDGDDSPGETPATARVSAALSAMEKLSDIDPSLSAQVAAVQGALFTLDEAARDLRSYNARLDFDPARLEEIEHRLGLIRDLKRKYGADIAGVLAFAAKARQDLSNLESADDRIDWLRHEFEDKRRQLGSIALGLSDKRRATAAVLETAVNRELKDLSMEKVLFRIAVTAEERADGLPTPDGRSLAYNNSGADKVEFLAATNPGEPPKPLEKIASTGELSRFTLAVKTALARADRSPVLIFDEIDIGVGGRSGDVIGRKLATLAVSHQVICVTHLPQIACYAAHHFSVRKDTAGNRAASRLDRIEAEERVQELALMLSGDPDSKASGEGARELLDKAARFLESLV